MKYTITIPEPCHENWNDMTPTEKGSFCTSCKKEVIDFTQTSNYALAKKLDTKKEVCGRFRPEQLNRPIKVAQNNRMYRVGMVLGFTSIFATATPVVAQINQTSTEIVEQPFVLGRIDVAQGLSDGIIVEGVVNDGKDPLPGAHVVLKGSEIGTQTDFDGVFRITIPSDKINSNAKLQVSYIGYTTNEIKIDDATGMTNVALTMEEDIMGEIVIIRKQNIFKRVGNLFKKKAGKKCKSDGAVK